VVIDECSMVGTEVGRDLLSFGKKILVCGDPAQLPPIQGGGFFTSGTPDFELTQVHRQARESGILELATHVREGGGLRDRVGWRSTSGDCEVISRDQWTAAQIMGRMMDADQVIVGTNRTRHEWNDRHRRLLGVGQPMPVAGDKVICLRNERRTGLLNGSRWRVLEASASADRKVVDLRLATEDGTYPAEVTTRSWSDHFLGREKRLDDLGPIRMSCQEFDFGYYVTCHKAQGSQWDDVVLYDESGVFDEDTRRRWLYTGITRATRRILVVA
jgi:exodeoxyribonuclease-5